MCQLPIHAQTFEKYISTSNDDVSLDALELDGGGYIILSQENAFDFSIHDYKINVYKLDQFGDFSDSLEIIIDEKYLLLYTRHIFRLEEGKFVIVGNARNRTTSDLQLYLATISTEMEFIKDTIIGDTLLSDYHIDFLINEFGYIIGTGYCENPINNQNIFFCEYNIEENKFKRVAYDIQHVSTNNIVELPEINAYHAQYVFSGDEIIQISRDSLTIDTIIINLPQFDPSMSINIPGSSNYLVMGKKMNVSSAVNELAFRIMGNSGNIIGEYCYGVQDTNCFFSFNEADCNNNNSLYLGGTHNFTLYPPYLYPGERRWIFVNKLKLDGTIIWQHFYKGEVNYMPYKILATEDGGALILSHKYDWDSPYPNQRDIHILKVDSNGYYSGITSIDDITGMPLQILVYPNPANSNINIASGNYYNLEFAIYDLKGHLFLQKELIGSLHKINIERLPPDLYIYKVWNDNGFSESGKLIVR